MIKRLLLITTLLASFAGNAQNAPSAQWHFEGNRTNNTGNVTDWVINMIATDKNEYIACGYTYVSSSGGGVGVPVIFKLDHLGNLVWSKPITIATGANGMALNLATESGIFSQVIKTTAGKYAAVGYSIENTTQRRRMVIIEVDESGNITTGVKQLFDVQGVGFSSGSTHDTRASSIAMDPTNSYYIVTGTCLEFGATNPANKLHVTKIDYPAGNNVQSVLYGNTGGVYGAGGNQGAKVLTKANGSDFDIFVCGYESEAGDNVVTQLPNADQVNTSGTVAVTSIDKDILFLKLKGSTLSTSLAKRYNKNNLPPVPANAEVGPGSARAGTNSSGTYKINSSPAAGILSAPFNKDEKASDMIFTQDGNLALTATVNNITPAQNGNFIFNNQGDHIHDFTRNHEYEDYKDQDAYLLKIDYAGNILPGTCYAGHFSGADFTTRMTQLKDGTYIIAGTSSDYYTTTADVKTPEEQDAYMVAIEDGTGNRKWRRTYNAADKEDCFCGFGITATADGGFAIGGNNDNDAINANGDGNGNFSISKFAPPCAKGIDKTLYAFGTDKTHTLTGDELWSNNNVNGQPFGGFVNIRTHIIVPCGKVLTIDNCNLRFASSDHIYDYFRFLSPLPGGITDPGTKIGIEVQPGGKLVIRNNSILEGIHECNDHYMWDGITIVGDPSNPWGQTGASTQGQLVMSDNSAIKDARIAVEVSDAYRQYNTASATVANSSTGITTATRYNEDAGKGGGVIDIQNSTLQNNRLGIRFQYTNFNSNLNHLLPVNPGFIKGNTFLNDDYLADPCFYIGADGNRYGALSFIGTWGVPGYTDGSGNTLRIRVYENMFNCSLKPTQLNLGIRPYGITFGETSIDIGIDPVAHPVNGNTIGGLLAQQQTSSPGNTFKGLGTAIEGGQSINLALPVRIGLNTFDNNNVGVNMHNSNALQLHYNKFQIPATSPLVLRPLGANIVGCKDYDVQDNIFDMCSTCTQFGSYTSTGLVIKNIGDNSELVKNNTFDNLTHPAVTLQYNGSFTGLQWKCNDFGVSTPINSIERISTDASNGSVVPATMCSAQGGQDITDPTSPANNRFYSLCSGSTTHLYADAQTTQVVTYNYNPTDPAYNPGCYTPYLYLPNPIFINSQDGCPSRFSTGGAYITLGNINNQLSTAGLNENDRAFLLSEQWTTVGEIVRELSDEMKFNAAAMLLENYGRYNEALPYYVQTADWNNANRVWSLLPLKTVDDQEYAQLTRLAIDLFAQGLQWDNLSGEQKTTIGMIARTNTAAGYMAQGIAVQLGINNLYNWPVPELSAGVGPDGTMKRSPLLQNAVNSANIFPNPTTGSLSTVVSEPGTLQIRDFQGKVIGSWNLKKGTNNVELPFSIAEGVYFAQYISASGNSSYNTKLVYQH